MVCIVHISVWTLTYFKICVIIWRHQRRVLFKVLRKLRQQKLAFVRGISMGNHGDSSSTSLSESPSTQVKYTKISTKQMASIVKLRPLSDQANHLPPPSRLLNVFFSAPFHQLLPPPTLPHPSYSHKSGLWLMYVNFEHKMMLWWSTKSQYLVHWSCHNKEKRSFSVSVSKDLTNYWVSCHWNVNKGSTYQVLYVAH